MLPEKYKFLEEIGILPKLVSAALQYLGLKEYPGTGNNNPVIMNMATSLGLSRAQYGNDEVAWCALFISFLMKITGKPLPFTGYDLIRAKSYMQWGNPVSMIDIRLGDVVVKHRVGGDHVFLAIAESEHTIHGLGGNQSNCVCFAEMDKLTITAVRRYYATTIPNSAKKYYINSSGVLSKSEA